MKKRVLKSLGRFIILVMIATLAVGCATSTPTTNPTTKAPAGATTAAPAAGATTAVPSAGTTTAAPAKKVAFNMAWWGAELRHNKFNAILDLYESKNPGVTIERQYAPWGDYWTKLATQAAGGNMPDTFGMTAQYKGDYASKKVMVDLKPYVDKGLIDISKFTPGAIDAGKSNNTLNFITFGDTATVLIYNKTLIEKAGVPLPKGEMSFEAYKAWLVQLQAKLPAGSYAGGVDVKYEHGFENYVRQMGYELTSADGKTIGYPKEILKNWYTFWIDLMNLKVVPNAEVFASQTGKQWADTLNGQGKIACWAMNCNQGKVYQASLKDELGMVRGWVDQNAKRKYVEMVQPSGWTIYEKSTQKDAVAKMISFFVNDKEAETIFNMELGNPGSTVIQEMFISTLKPETSLIDNTKKIEMTLMKTILTSIEPYGMRAPGVPALITDMGTKFDEVMFKRLTIDQAVDAHFAAVSTLLK